MEKITRIEDFAGKTIRLATESLDGRGLVIVFDDNDWAVLHPDDCTCEDSCVDIDRMSGTPRSYLTPDGLLAADLINRGQYELIKREDAAKKVSRLRSHAERLLAEAASLEQRTYILVGPQGIGKSTHAARLAKLLGCRAIQDEWNGQDLIHPGTLAITNAIGHAAPAGATCLQAKDAGDLARLISDLER